jgi:competence protein ComGC
MKTIYRYSQTLGDLLLWLLVAVALFFLHLPDLIAANEETQEDSK